MAKKKWTKDKCFEEAKKYSKRSDFQKNASQAFHVAIENGWIEEMGWLKKKAERRPNGYWKNKENFMKEAERYTSRKELEKNNLAAYAAGLKYGYLDELKQFNKTLAKQKHPKGYWKNRKNMINEAKKYKTKEEFQKENLSAFLAAYRYGYIDEMTWLVRQKQHKNGYWTYEHIQDEALKYDTKTEFSKYSNTAYRAALKLGIIDDFFSLNNGVE